MRVHRLKSRVKVGHTRVKLAHSDHVQAFLIVFGVLLEFDEWNKRRFARVTNNIVLDFVFEALEGFHY